MSKRPLALLLGITGDLAFAAGCLLLALRRHSPTLNPDIILYNDGTLLPHDESLLRTLGARPVLFVKPEGAFNPDAVRKFSYLTLARLEGLLMLETYSTVLWLDVDTAIQDDIAPLTTYGPFSLALEDPCFTESGKGLKARVNISGPVPELDLEAPNINSGVLVLQDSLPNPEGMYRQCMDWFRAYAPYLNYMDQGVLNLLAQQFQRETPELFSFIPHDRFNAHPRNPAAQRAAIVHAFGAYKLWDDGLTRCSFPEWERDYFRWLDMGGSPWQGKIENEEYLEGGAFFMLARLHKLAESAEGMLHAQQKELESERALRMRLEKTLKKLSS